MSRKTNIVSEERAKCRQVADAFAELYAQEDILVLDAGDYGFVVLQYYTSDNQFENTETFVDSHSLFEHLWREWLNAQLFTLSKGTPQHDMLYEDMFKVIPAGTQKELLAKRLYFAEKAGLPELAQEPMG